jgi:MFS family permease
LPSFLIAAGQQAVLVLLPLYALQLDGGAAFAATLLAVRGFGSLVANVPAGMLVSRLGDKAVMVASLLMLGLSATLLGQTTSLLLAALLSGVFGAGSGAWLLSRLVYVTEAAPLGVRGRAIAALGGIQRVGLLVGPVVGGTLATTMGYDIAFLFAGGCAFASCLVVVPFTRNVKPILEAGGGPSLRTVSAIVRDHRHTFSTAGMATIGLAVLRSSRQLLVPLWGAAVGLTEAEIGLIFMITSAIEIAMSYPAGYLLDLKGHKATALPCFGLLALSILLLPLAGGFWSLTGIALIAGLGNGFGTGIQMTMGSDYAPRLRRGEFLGVWRMMGDSGAVAGPLLIGALTGVVTLGGATVGAAVVGLLGMLIMATVVQEPVRQ